MKIMKTEKMAVSRHLTVFQVQYLDSTGAARSWEMVSRNRVPVCDAGPGTLPNAVVIVPFHVSRNRLVLIREFRVPLGGWQYGFPAGLLDPGEEEEAAACRELLEETGLIADRLMHVSPPLFTSSGLSDESVSMVYLTCHGEVTSRNNSPSEHIETLFVSPAEAGTLVANRDIMLDVKTWLVLTAYAANGKLVIPSGEHP